MLVDEAYGLISRAIDAGKAAHGYLICGDLEGNCLELTNLILRKLFPNALSQIEANSHPDVIRLEPEGAKRIITVKSMREQMVDPMSVTSFSGGWKVGIIFGADRMEAPSANAFLKTLEEPPAKTLFLLLTDQPDIILPTIVSRTQRVDLPLPSGLAEGEIRDLIASIFEGNHPDGVLAKSLAAKAMAEKLAELKEGDGDFAVIRKSFYKTILSFVRKWMIEGSLPAYRAFRNIEEVETAFHRSANSMNDEAVLSCMLDKIVFP